MPAWSMPSTSTTKLPIRVSWLPKLRYWSRHIGHSLTGSSVVDVPGWGMQAKLKKPHRAESKAASGRLVGPLKREAAGLPQSVWKPELDAVGATEVVAVDLAVVGVGGARGRGPRAIEVAGQHHVAAHQAREPGDV